MYIKNEDLDFLIKLAARLDDIFDSNDKDVRNLQDLIGRLVNRRKNQNEYTRNFIAEKRKTDKNYARSKQVQNVDESNDVTWL